MNTTAITLLKNVMSSPAAAGKLKEILGIKDWQFNAHVKRLTQKGYLKREASQIVLQDNAKTALLQSISARQDIGPLFRRSNELIFSHLAELTTVGQIVKDTGLSAATVYKAITDLQAVGAIKKDAGSSNDSSRTADRFSANPSGESLVLFAKILKIERERTHEYGAEIIYRDDKRTIRKVPTGRTAQGHLTAFSMFFDYGISYHSPYDYYVKQDIYFDLEDVIIHSMLAALKNSDKTGMIMVGIFYLKNKDKVDVPALRKRASTYGVLSIWVDMEGYLGRKKLKNPKLFLPWEEFLEKAELYNIPLHDYSVPELDLFGRINAHLPGPVRIFLLGEENMRIKNLALSTKSCDMAVETRKDFDVLFDTLVTKLGYGRATPTEFSQEGRRLYLDATLTHSGCSRIHLFTGRIMGQVPISAKMVRMADYQEHGNLRVGILRNEHVFVLKAATGSEGDIQDMAMLAGSSGIQPQKFQHGSFDWDVVWEEILCQEQQRASHIHDSTLEIFEQIAILAEYAGIRVPFLGKLRRHAIDRMVERLIRDSKKPLSDTVSILTGGDISGQMVRNRVDVLERSGSITKFLVKNNVFIRSSRTPLFQERDWTITQETMKTYLA